MRDVSYFRREDIGKKKNKRTKEVYPKLDEAEVVAPELVIPQWQQEEQVP